MVEDKLKLILGELMFQNAVLTHQIEELKKEKEKPSEG